MPADTIRDLNAVSRPLLIPLYFRALAEMDRIIAAQLEQSGRRRLVKILTSPAFLGSAPRP